ncbi:MAG TPA: hypothetical protein VGA56_13030 [Opitutaceae bacterium]
MQVSQIGSFADVGQRRDRRLKCRGMPLAKAVHELGDLEIRPVAKLVGEALDARASPR